MTGSGNIEWRHSPGLTPYPDALAEMERRVEAIQSGAEPELIWLLEHPPLYTAGTSSDPAELFNPQGFPVYQAGRGGRYTYHGPGQRVGYLMLDLNKRGRDVRNFVHALEGWLIGALEELGIHARRAPGRIGIWVDHGSTEAKVGAIGVRVRKWVTMHGFSINISPELSHFSG
jgi:lipoyl(octanoyl) transferase